MVTHNPKLANEYSTRIGINGGAVSLIPTLLYWKAESRGVHKILGYPNILSLQA